MIKERIKQIERKVTAEAIEKAIEELQDMLDNIDDEMDMQEDLDIKCFKETINEKNLLESIDAICGAFVWSYSPQGATYWNEVYDNLESIYDEFVEDDE